MQSRCCTSKFRLLLEQLSLNNGGQYNCGLVSSELPSELLAATRFAPSLAAEKQFQFFGGAGLLPTVDRCEMGKSTTYSMTDEREGTIVYLVGLQHTTLIGSHGPCDVQLPTAATELREASSECRMPPGYSTVPGIVSRPWSSTRREIRHSAAASFYLRARMLRLYKFRLCFRRPSHLAPGRVKRTAPSPRFPTPLSPLLD